MKSYKMLFSRLNRIELQKKKRFDSFWSYFLIFYLELR